MAAEILGALQIHVGAAPTRGRPTENTDAYALFLRAKAAMNRWDAVSAEDFLLQAVELDAEFAEAWELLAYAYWEQWGNQLSAVKARPQTFDAATRALSIDPDLLLAQVMQTSADPESSWLPKEIEGLERILRIEPNNAVAAEIMAWDLAFFGYFHEALQIAEHTVRRDPLSPNAQLNLFNTLYTTGRRTDSLAALELADELGSIYAKMTLSFIHHRERNYELSIEYIEAHLRERGLPHGWVRSLHVGASDPATGQAHLDRRIPEIMESVPGERAYEMQLFLDGSYLTYGFLDRYFELIIEYESSSPFWGDAITLISNGIFDRDSGFTAHSRFLEVAEGMGFVELWETRGPPDFCGKTSGEWVCE